MTQMRYEFKLKKQKDFYNWEIRIEGEDMNAIATRVQEIDAWAKAKYEQGKVEEKS